MLACSPCPKACVTGHRKTGFCRQLWFQTTADTTRSNSLSSDALRAGSTNGPDCNCSTYSSLGSLTKVFKLYFHDPQLLDFISFNASIALNALLEFSQLPKDAEAKQYLLTLSIATSPLLALRLLWTLDCSSWTAERCNLAVPPHQFSTPQPPTYLAYQLL